MLRRNFIQNSFVAASSFGMFSVMKANATENNSFDGGFLDQNADGSVNFYSHDFQENMYYQKQLFDDGHILNSERHVVYKKENLILFPYNHPKMNTNLMLYIEFSKDEKKLSKYHFLNVLPESQDFEFLHTYETTESVLHGKEQLKLLLDNPKENDVATLFYSDNETLKVGSFRTNGDQLEFKSICDLGEMSAQFSNASWHGPYHDLIGEEKNVFFALQEGVGFSFFQFDGENINLLTQIEHNQNFDNFTYYYPKLTRENIEENKTRYFSVMTPHAPQGVLSSNSALMLTSNTGVHFLSYNKETSQFEVLYQDKNFIQNNIEFLSAQTNYTRDNQPDLFLFYNFENYLYSALIYNKSTKKFEFEAKKLPLSDVDTNKLYVNVVAKKISSKTNLRSSRLLSASSSDSSYEFTYPLSFSSETKSSYYHLTLKEDGKDSCLLVNEKQAPQTLKDDLKPKSDTDEVPEKNEKGDDDIFDDLPLDKDSLLYIAAGLVGVLVLTIGYVIYLKKNLWDLKQQSNKSLPENDTDDIARLKSDYTRLEMGHDNLLRQFGESQTTMQGEIDAKQDTISFLGRRISALDERIVSLQRGIEESSAISGLEKEASERTIQELKRQLRESDVEVVRLSANGGDLASFARQLQRDIYQQQRLLFQEATVKCVKLEEILNETQKKLEAVEAEIASGASEVAGNLEGIYKSMCPPQKRAFDALQANNRRLNAQLAEACDKLNELAENAHRRGVVK